MNRHQIVAGIALIALAGAGIVLGNGYQLFVLSLMGLTAIVAVGLNILVGMTGQISLGHIGFYAIGAYVVAILTTSHGWSFWPALPLGMLLAGLAGGLLSIPALRVRGPYLAMITIAFAFIVEQGAAEMVWLTGGWNGILGIPSPVLFGEPLRPAGMACLILVFTVATFLFYATLSRSQCGQALRAIRDSEVAAASIGFDPVRLRSLAFALSAAFAGLAGGLYAALSAFVSPESFPFFDSILFLLVVMIGGADKTLGPAIGAAVVVLLPEAFSFLAEYRLLFVGILLLIVLRVAPGGIAGIIESFSRRAGAARPPSPRSAVQARIDTSSPINHPDPVALEVRDLSIRFGGVKALQEVSFSAEPGRITSVIGPNGAGKTTALNLIVGLYTPDTGSIELGGQSLVGLSRHNVARAGVGRTFQTTQLFGNMSVLDNVLVAMISGRVKLSGLGAPLAESGRVQKAEALLSFVGYRGDLHAPASALAHIDRRLVEISRALAFAPKILLLDEPAAGLGEEDTRRLDQLLRDVAASGIGVVLVEHDMDLVMGISDRVVVLDSGRCIADGLPETVRNDPAVLSAYLGEQNEDSVPRDAPRHSDAKEVLGASDLKCGYGASEVLRGIDLRVDRGELVAVLGANGAGKTTLMHALSGLHRPVTGEIRFAGKNVSDHPAHHLSRIGIALVPEGRQVFGNLNVIQNIRLGAYGRRPEDLDSEIELLLDRFPRLRERRQQPAGLLSGGEQQMLAIARGLVSRPAVLLLDEPSLGLAPTIIQELYASLAALRDDGATILLVDQMADMALAIADRAYVLSGGLFAASGTAAEIRSSRHLNDAYLGSAAAGNSSPNQ